MRAVALIGIAICAAGSVMLFLQGEGGNAFAVLGVALIAALGWITVSDLRDWIIPDQAVLALAGLAIAWRFIEAPIGLTGFERAFEPALGFLFAGGSLWLLREAYYRRAGRDGVGLGDVKLAAAGGILVGLFGFAWALLAASLGGLLIVVVLRLAKPEWISDRVPFGALLAPALFVTWAASSMPFEWLGGLR